jgi:hypothetical protein
MLLTSPKTTSPRGVQMERDKWRKAMTGAIVISLVLALVAIGLGIAALHKTSPSSSVGGPLTTLVLPATGATVSGRPGLDAKPIGAGVVAVDFLATGGTMHDAKIAGGSATPIGWLGTWDSRTMANGTYSLVSVSYDAQGRSGRSSSVVVTVKN